MSNSQNNRNLGEAARDDEKFLYHFANGEGRFVNRAEFIAEKKKERVAKTNC